MIPYTDFRRLLADVSECPDFDSYAAEVGCSVPLDDGGDVIRTLSCIWEMAHGGLSIKRISAAFGIPVRQIALQYGLPTRTVENWSSGTTLPPAWQLPLIAYAILSDRLPVRA